MRTNYRRREMLCSIQEGFRSKKYAKPIIAILFVIALFVVFRHKKSNTESKDNIIPIEASTVKRTEFPLYISALGTVTPKDTVSVKTQINGQIIKIGFEDGQMVKKDDLLVQIDPSLYQAQFEQYLGQLERDEAILANSLLDLKRYEELWKQNSVSKQTLDTQIATVKQNEGIVLLDKGLLDGAEVNLSYCSIRAPFDGQVGIANVREGNLVQSSDQTAIVTINSIDPILVLFSIPEVELPSVLTEFKKGNLIVEAYDQSFTKLLSKGELVAIDNQIDTATGTVKLKGLFANPDRLLYPNQFVNVKLLIKNENNVITVPSPAVQYGPKGSFVYLIDEDKTNVSVRAVTTGTSSGTSTIIENGLDEGDQVAITGVDKLKDGAYILINNNGF